MIQRIAREHNTGVILCSHLLSEIEGICDDVIILSQGQVVAQGSVNEVVGQAQQNVVRVRVPAQMIEEAQKTLLKLTQVTKVMPTGQMGGWLGVELASPDGVPQEDFRTRNKILEALIVADIPILGFEAEGGRLQDVFLELTAEVI
jgi:ABC-2 type transport system ATP-binding protein